MDVKVLNGQTFKVFVFSQPRAIALFVYRLYNKDYNLENDEKVTNMRNSITFIYSIKIYCLQCV